MPCMWATIYQTLMSKYDQHSYRLTYSVLQSSKREEGVLWCSLSVNLSNQSHVVLWEVEIQEGDHAQSHMVGTKQWNASPAFSIFFNDMILSKAAMTHWVTRKTQLFKKVLKVKIICFDPSKCSRKHWMGVPLFVLHSEKLKVSYRN